ncbi:hypothetical protein OG471_05100 [Streptomyces sp. NBC_01336]|uniref:hypothetical protein n=1 Tax=Streptomyces sp. NBC_01336 TaxID=2903829 RepID=UPI002E1543B8|nr:hypothetical protein OG471_05100 [Streptomyces sp. NBC_01336]
MTPTAISVGACCSLLRAGIERPAEMSRSIDLSGLVDAEGGLVDRAVFTDTERYRQEWGRVFARNRTRPDLCPTPELWCAAPILARSAIAPVPTTVGRSTWPTRW